MRLQASARGTAGFSVAELLVALLAGTGVVVVALSSWTAALRSVAVAVERAALDEAGRTVGIVLARELRSVDPTRDVAIVAPDSIALRAFRGTGVICAAALDTVWVSYRGARAVDVTKDSLLWPAPDGPELTLHALTVGRAARVPAGCVPRAGRRVVRLVLAAPAPRTGVLLAFERGSYHLSGRAFRYRRGHGGRQPLTATWLDTPPSAFQGAGPDGTPVADGGDLQAVRVTLGLRGAVRGGRYRRTVRLRVSFLNVVGRGAP